MAAARSKRVCDHAAHECFGSNSTHRMACACGCGTTFDLADGSRLAWGPAGFGGNWFAPRHGPARLERPEPAIAEVVTVTPNR